jgi:tRNA dimethylallyltransferase
MPTRVVFIVGPTATGKTDFALEVCEKFKSEIVNGDSLQVYKELNIGTAKPSLQQRGRIPHHLFDVVDLGGAYTAADYREQSLYTLQQIEKRNLPLACVVGGSGFYLQALYQGMYSLPKVSGEIKQKAQELITQSADLAYQELCRLDPEYGQKVSSKDHYRVQRGLEMIWSSGKTVTETKKDFTESSATAFPFKSIWIGLDQAVEDLKQRVALRVKLMLEQGLIQEVIDLREKLRKRNMGNWPPLQSVGYKEVQELLDGKIKQSELAEKIVISTMQLAKKQRTWFRNQVDTKWISHSAEGLSLIGEFLSEQ